MSKCNVEHINGVYTKTTTQHLIVFISLTWFSSLTWFHYYATVWERCMHWTSFLVIVEVMFDLRATQDFAVVNYCLGNEWVQ